MEKQRYVVLDKNGKANIVQKADSRFVGIDEMAQHIAFDIIEDYKSIIDAIRKSKKQILICLSKYLPPFRLLGTALDLERIANCFGFC